MEKFGALFLIGVVMILAACTTPAPVNHQMMVHNMGSQVMPFDLNKTTHVFEMTETGGIQLVRAKDSGDSVQITLIRQHLHYEALQFSQGNFSDPATLHGKEMPGVKELTEGFSLVKIAFSAEPDGAKIIFDTQDIHLITAIHRWFGAQLSDHGMDASYR